MSFAQITCIHKENVGSVQQLLGLILTNAPLNLIVFVRSLLESKISLESNFCLE